MHAATHAATGAASHIASAKRAMPKIRASTETRPDHPSTPTLSVPKLLGFTAPFHVALPLIMSAGWDLHPQLVTWGWVALHLLFPLVLIATYKWWVGQGEKIFLVLVLNHIITFGTFAAMSVFRAVV